MSEDAAIEVKDVTRILPGPVPVTLVKNINMTVRKGELVAVTGPSGSGKSSLLYLLGLLDRPTEGRVILSGKDTSTLGRRELASLRLQQLGFVFQFHYLLEEFSALDNVMIPMRKLGRLSPRQIRRRAMELLDSLGLEKKYKNKPPQLSGGERQRVAIARALANEPLVILTDEPTGNLDTKNADAVFSILKKLCEERGTTILCVTHDEDIAKRTHRRIHLVDGEITEAESG